MPKSDIKCFNNVFYNVQIVNLDGNKLRNMKNFFPNK